MLNPIKAFKAATMQTKIFWIIALGIGLLNLGLCLYPYIWFDLHRSGKTESVQND